MKTTRCFSVVGAALLLIGVAQLAYAAPISSGTKIAFDIQGSSGTASYAFPGLLVDANSTWNVTSSNIVAGSVVDVSGTVVDGVSVARFGSTWSNWGSVAFAPETNLVTQDYLFDNNGVNVNGMHSLWTIGGLDPNRFYNLAIHANRIQSSNGGVTDGATVLIGIGAPVVTPIATQVLPTIAGGAAALWPNGGFQAGLTSALFTRVAPQANGSIQVYFNKGGVGNVIFTGAELSVYTPEPSTFVLAALGLVGLVTRRRRRHA